MVTDSHHSLDGSLECCKGHERKSLKSSTLNHDISERKRLRPMKFWPLHYVLFLYKTAKFHWNRFTNDCSSTPQHWRLGCPFFFFFFFRFFFCFLKNLTNHNCWPIWASNTSKRVFWCKEVPFGVTKDTNFSFDPQNPQKPQFLVLPMHFLWETKISITFQPLIAKKSNFTSLIPCICSTIVHYQKIEFRNPRWPTAPFWIFKSLLKFEYLLNR